MTITDHSRRLVLITKKYASGDAPSGLTERPPFSSGLTRQEEVELQDLEGLLAITIRRLWPY